MPDVREAYEMVTKQKPPEPGALERQQRKQVRSARNKRFGAFAVAAAIGLAAVVLLLANRPAENVKTPATAPTTRHPIDPAATEIATDFARAVGPSTRTVRSPTWPTPPTFRRGFPPRICHG